MAFAVCLSHLFSLSSWPPQTKQREGIAFIPQSRSAAKRPRNDGTAERGGGGRLERNYLPTGIYFFQSSTLDCFCSITRAEKYSRGCVKSTPKFKVERERDPATTKTTTFHLTDRGPARGRRRGRSPINRSDNDGLRKVKENIGRAHRSPQPSLGPPPACLSRNGERGQIYAHPRSPPPPPSRRRMHKYDYAHIRTRYFFLHFGETEERVNDRTDRPTRVTFQPTASSPLAPSS